MSIDDRPYLILGGAPKCATTSMFYALAEHPDICASTIKEPGFFCGPDADQRGDCIDDVRSYMDLFVGYKPGNVCLEATPFYLYDRHSAQAIRESLPNARMAFSLRDPIERTFSGFRYAAQQSFVAAGLSFADYVQKQVSAEIGPNGAPSPTLERGRYSRWLQFYYSLFGQENVLVVFHEDYAAAPNRCLKTIAEFVSLPTEFFENWAPRVYNRTKQVGSMGATFERRRSVIRQRLFPFTSRHPTLQAALHRCAQWCADIVDRDRASSPSVATGIPEPAADQLREYFKGEADAIERLSGRRPPWPRL